MSVIQTKVHRALSKGFWNDAFYSAVEKAVQKRVPKPPSVDAVAARLLDGPTLTVSSAKFVKHEVEKSSLDKAEIEERFVRLVEAVAKKNQGQKRNFDKKIRNCSISSPPTGISDDKVTNQNAYKTETSSDASNARSYYTRLQKRGSRRLCIRRHHRSPTPLAHMRSDSQSGRKGLIAVNENYQKAVDYPSYHLISKLQRYDDDVTLKMLTVRKKVTG